GQQSTASISTLLLTSDLATLSATSARSNRFCLIFFPMLLSSRRREDGSALTPGKPTARWRFQSVIPGSASPLRTRQRSSRNFARWEATMLTREKERDLGLPWPRSLSNYMGGRSG